MVVTSRVLLSLVVVNDAQIQISHSHWQSHKYYDMLCKPH